MLYRAVEHSERENKTCRQRYLGLPTSTVRIFANGGTRNDLSFVPELSGQALESLACKLCGTPLIFQLVVLKEPFKIEEWAVWCRCFEEYGKQKFCTLNRTETDWAALATVE